MQPGLGQLLSTLLNTRATRTLSMISGKENWKLNQKDAIKLVELEVSPEIGGWIELKNRLAKSNGHRVSQWDPVGRLNHIVRQGAPPTHLRAVYRRGA